MTTIVAVESEKGTTFASDTRITGVAVNDGWVSKVFEKGDLVIGVAGFLRVAQMINYAKLPEPPKSIKPHKVDRWMTNVFCPMFIRANLEFANGDKESAHASRALVSVRGRLYQVDAYGTWTRNTVGVYSIGSGAKYALGAISAGATPKQAVKIASSFDWGTNSDVSVIKTS